MQVWGQSTFSGGVTAPILRPARFNGFPSFQQTARLPPPPEARETRGFRAQGKTKRVTTLRGLFHPVFATKAADRSVARRRKLAGVAGEDGLSTAFDDVPRCHDIRPRAQNKPTVRWCDYQNNRSPPQGSNTSLRAKRALMQLPGGKTKKLTESGNSTALGCSKALLLSDRILSGFCSLRRRRFSD